MKKSLLLFISILFLALLAGCSYTQEEYNEAKEQAYEDGYYDAIHEAKIGEIDEARHGELIDYVVEYSWKDVVKSVLEDDPQILLDYIEEHKKLDLDEVTFIANTSSQIYHVKDCSHVESISEDNILYWCDTEDALVQAGYSPCSDCIHPETTEGGETTVAGTPINHTYDLETVEWVETPDSSAFCRIGYDESEEDLVVEFWNSGLYVYHDVPEEEWVNLQNAESKGNYYNHEIKGHYECEKIVLDE